MLLKQKVIKDKNNCLILQVYFIKLIFIINPIFLKFVLIFLHQTYLTGGVVLIGGQSGNTILNTLYKLTSISETWTEIDSKLKIPRRNFASWTIPSHLLADCYIGEIIFFNVYSSTLKNTFCSPPTAINTKSFKLINHQICQKAVLSLWHFKAFSV